MKAEDLLALVQESSKGTKHVDGEVKVPSYDNLNTPDNHVDGKGTKEVTNAKKDFGKKRDMKNKANPGKPKKKEAGRDMEGPGKSYKRMGEAQGDDVKDYEDAPWLKDDSLEVGGSPEDEWAGNPWAERQRQHAKKRAAFSPQQAHQVGKLKDMGVVRPEDLEESYATDDSMAEKPPVKKRGPVSKTAKVRGKVNDEPENKGDPGKPKTSGKEVQGDGANLGKIMNPKKVAKVEEGIGELEAMLGRKLNLKKKLTELRATQKPADLTPMQNRYWGWTGLGDAQPAEGGRMLKVLDNRQRPFKMLTIKVTNDEFEALQRAVTSGADQDLSTVHQTLLKKAGASSAPRVAPRTSGHVVGKRMSPQQIAKAGSTWAIESEDKKKGKKKGKKKSEKNEAGDDAAHAVASMYRKRKQCRKKSTY